MQYIGRKYIKHKRKEHSYIIIITNEKITYEEFSRVTKEKEKRNRQYIFSISEFTKEKGNTKHKRLRKQKRKIN